MKIVQLCNGNRSTLCIQFYRISRRLQSYLIRQYILSQTYDTTHSRWNFFNPFPPRLQSQLSKLSVEIRNILVNRLLCHISFYLYLFYHILVEQTKFCKFYFNVPEYVLKSANRALSIYLSYILVIYCQHKKKARSFEYSGHVTNTESALLGFFFCSKKQVNFTEVSILWVNVQLVNLVHQLSLRSYIFIILLEQPNHRYKDSCISLRPINFFYLSI